MGWLYVGQDGNVMVWACCIYIRIWVEYMGWLNLGQDKNDIIYLLYLVQVKF
jgi:hypothetical protein